MMCTLIKKVILSDSGYTPNRQGLKKEREEKYDPTLKPLRSYYN